MDIRSPFFSNLALALAGILFLNPIVATAAQLTVDAAAGGNTSLGQAGNGVPLVNIATPNGKGLSHNKFTDYNVGQQGLILNNATGRTQSTQLGGIILGNPNLNGQAAGMILNEVTGSNRSQLKGYTEVAGQAARVIVANPHGITCDGCGFINTPRVSLSTGKPVIANGMLDRFDVDGGQIGIEGGGLNAANVSQFDLITRSAKINAELHAQQLNVITGRNEVKADSLAATAKAEDGRAKPQLAIDSSALGGMYAGAIRLVGTEQGVGVKLAGNMAASGGDIQLDINGKLSLAQTVSSGNLQASAQSLDLTGPAYAAGNVNLQAREALLNQHSLAAAGNVVLSGQQLDNQGIVEAGVNPDSSRNGAGNLTITSQNLRNKGTLLAGGDLHVQSTQSLDNQGGTLSGRTALRIDAGQVTNQQGKLLSDGQLQLTAGALDNQRGLIVSQGELTAQIERLDNSQGEISSHQNASLSLGDLDNTAGTLLAEGELSVKVSGQVTNQGGILSGHQGLDIEAARLDNSRKGSLVSQGDVTVNVAGLLDNSSEGNLISQRMLSIQAGELSNRGRGVISSQGNLHLAGNILQNQGGTILSNAALHLTSSELDNSQAGLIHSGGPLHLTGGVFDNSGGELSARGDLYLTVQQLIQRQGRLIGEGALHLDLQHGDLDNRGGLVAARGPLTMANLHALDNREQGEISSDRAISLSALTLDNGDQGLIASAETLSVQAQNLRNAQGGLLTGWQGLEVRGGQLDNSSAGTLSSREGTLDVLLTGALNNQNQGALVSRGNMRVEANNLDNSEQGILSTDGNLQLAIAAGLVNAEGGLIAASGNLEGHVTGIDNRAGQFSAGQDLRLTGTHLDNRAGQLSAQGGLSLELLGSLNNSNQARIGSGGPLLIRSAGVDNRAGQVVSQGLLNLVAGSFDNSSAGTLAAREALSLDLSGALNNSQDGLIHSQAATLDIHAASLDNSAGTLQSQGDMTVATDQALLNQNGRIQSQDGNLDLSASRIDNSNGGILSSMVGWLKLAVGGLFDNSSGLTQAQSLNIAAQQGVNNNSGHLSALANDARIETQDFDNRNGGLYANGLLTLTGRGFDNSGGKVAAGHIDFSLSGALNNQLGLIESDTGLNLTAASLDNRQGALRALGSGGQTRIVTQAGLDNRGGMLETANFDLDLNVAGLQNANGKLLHVGNGTFQVATATVIQAGGSLVSNGALTLNATSWANSSLLQAGRLTLNVGTFSQTASGQLLASQSLDATGGNWTNHGLIASDGSLNLNLSGTYSGNGRLTSLGNLELQAAALSLASTSRIAGGGVTNIGVAGLLTNHGRLTSTGDFSLRAATLNNFGTLGGAERVDVWASALRNEGGLIFSGADMAVRGSDLLNLRGDIYSLGDLAVTAMDGTALAQRFRNLSGTVESAGAMSIAARTLENARESFDISTEKISARIVYLGCGDCGGNKESTYFLIEQIDRTEAQNVSPMAQLLSGGNLTLRSDTLDNRYSLIASGANLLIDTGSLNNLGAQSGDITTTEHLDAHRVKMKYVYARQVQADSFNERNWIGSAKYAPGDITGELNSFIKDHGYRLHSPGTPVYSNAVNYNATIQAAGGVTIKAAKQVNNSVIRPSFSYVSGGNRVASTAPGSRVATTVTLTSQLPPDLQQQQVNPLALPGFSLPQSENGLFRLSTQGGQTVETRGEGALNGQIVEATLIQPQTLSRVQGLPEASRPANAHKYLIETNPALTDLKQFMGSDYLLGNLGVDPDLAQKRLGDGLYEQRLIREAVVARTGARYLDGMSSDEEMFRYLMDNAIASKDELNLSVGVGLTAEQVAALTHDIVWLEEHEVLGEKVLVPVLYLAQADGRLMANGALIQGQDVTLISGGELNNQGTLKASANLYASAENINNSGLLEANERLQLLATESIRNAQAGIIAGRDVSLSALTGDVINERTVARHASTYGGHRQETSFVDAAARIEATGNLSISAGRDLANLGGVLDSRGDISLQAGRDVTIAAVEEHYAQSAGSHFNHETITQLGAQVTAGGNLAINASNDLSVIASDVAAGQNLSVSAGNDVLIASAADESHSYSKSRKVTSSSDTVTQQSSSLTSGGDMTVAAGNDLTLVASQLKADGSVALNAEQDISVLSALDESASFYSKKRDGSFGRSKTVQKESYDSTNVASVIEAGKDLTINTRKTADGGLSINGGRDVTVIGSQLKAGSDLLIGATGDVAVLSGVEEHGAYSKTTKSSTFGLSKSGKSQLTTTASQVASELGAGNDVVIAAGGSIGLRASEISAGNDAELRAGLVDADGDINLVAAADTAYSLSERYRQKVGISTAKGSMSFASAKEAGQEAHSSTSVGSHVGAQRDATLQAERDINVVGSTVSAGRDVDLDAGRDVNVVAAVNSNSQRDWEHNKTVGISVTGDDNGVSLFAGVESHQEKTRVVTETASASLISAGNDLQISARRDIQQVGSDIQALNDLSLLAGRDIHVGAAAETLLLEQYQSTETQGLGVSVNHNFGRAKDAVNSADEGDNNVSKASGMLRAADSLNQFFAGPTADVRVGNSSQSSEQQVIEQSNRASTLASGNDLTLIAGNDVSVRGSEFRAGRDITLQGRDVTLDVARGEVVEESKQDQTWGGFNAGTSGGLKIGAGGSFGKATGDSSQGTSTVTQIEAGRDINLLASNDLNLIGTQVRSGRDIDLVAGNDLSIQAAQHENSSENSRRSGGGEVGLAIGSEGVGVYASVNLGIGDLEREGVKQRDAYLYAGGNLGFGSGRDTTVAGAQLEGETVTGQVGRDLSVSSVADTGKVEGEEFDVSVTVVIGPGSSVSGSVGYGKTTGKTNWVDTQTSITARDGLDIRTENHTQLDGALIASQAGNLILDTGSLGFSDIAGKDKEHGYYLSVGGSYGQEGSTQQDPSQVGKGDTGGSGWSVEGYDYRKDREQIVRATVGDGEIIVRNDAGAGRDSTEGLNRDVEKAYEITKDDEERTDLYVSESSLEAVGSPVVTVKEWGKDLAGYSEATLANYDQMGKVLNVGLLRVQEVLGGYSNDAVTVDGRSLTAAMKEALILSGSSWADAGEIIESAEFQAQVMGQIQTLQNIPLEDIQLVQVELEKAGVLESSASYPPSDVPPIYLPATGVFPGDEPELTAAQITLRKLAALNEYLQENQDKAALVGYALALAQGVKGVAMLVVEQAASQSELGKQLMDQMAIYQEAVGKYLAEGMEGNELDPVYDEEAALVGGGTLLIGMMLGAVPGKKGTKEVRAVSTPVYKTTKEAKAAAEAMGFKKINETIHNGQAVFKRGGEYITRDLDGHNGGAWKMADSVEALGRKETRSGTFDINLERIGD